MEKVSIKLVAAGYHPRREISGKDELKKSIEQEGLREPITVRRDGEQFILIDGLRRLQVIRELGWDEVPCHIEEADEKEAAHLSWAKNTHAYRKNLNPMEEAYHLQAMRDRFGYSVQDLVELGYAGHQDTIYKKLSLLNLHQDVQEQIVAGEVKPSTGYQLAKLKDNPEAQIKLAATTASQGRGAEKKIRKKVRAIKAAGRAEKKKAPVPIPEGEIPGVFFKDARDMSELQDESVGLIVTSPPYWAGFEYEAEVSFEEHLENLDAVLGESIRKLMYGGVCCLNYADVNSYGTRTGGAPEIQLMGGHYQELLRKHGLRITDVIHWRKGMNFRKYRQVQFNEDTRHTSYRILPNVEYILICRKDGKRDVPYDLEIESKLAEHEWKQFVDGVWDVWTGKNPEGHPAQFPEEIPRQLIKAYSYPSDLVVDPFLGSGTTVKVARELGRVGVGYERDERYKPVIMRKLGVVEDAPSKAQSDESIGPIWVDEEIEEPIEKVAPCKPVRIVDLTDYRFSEQNGDTNDDHSPTPVPAVVSEDIPSLNKVVLGDCQEKLKELPDNSVDQIVTDPPYGLKFMGKDWDKAVPGVEIWRECFRVMKAGAFLFVMASPRLDLQIRLGTNILEAGFKIGFSPIYWTYASGMPKAANIAKSASSNRGCEKEQVALLEGAYGGFQPKPAVEPVLVAMKPGKKKTHLDVALTNLKGITWLDYCRIPYVGKDFAGAGHRTATFGNQETIPGGNGSGSWEVNQHGRFPANLLVSDDVLDDGKKHPGGGVGGRSKHSRGEGYGFKPQGESAPEVPKDNGGYSRFFSLDAWAERNLPFLIVPKPSKAEKEMGLGKGADKIVESYNQKHSEKNVPHKARPSGRKNNHPTVKPVKLMAYLITMGSREGDLILDPFAGSGTTCMAAKRLGRRFIGIELSEEYREIAEKRVASVEATKRLPEPAEKERTKAPGSAQKRKIAAVNAA